MDSFSFWPVKIKLYFYHLILLLSGVDYVGKSKKKLRFPSFPVGSEKSVISDPFRGNVFSLDLFILKNESEEREIFR